MREIIEELISLIKENEIKNSGIIEWAAPVPSFGDAENARIATLGINPSDKEFIDNYGNELAGESRRFHTLASFGIRSWDQISTEQIEEIESSCTDYFHRNPYNSWFRPLNKIISGSSASYYDKTYTACHLDLVPFATKKKWSSLTEREKKTLLSMSAYTLGKIIKRSKIKAIILNGRSVINQFTECSNATLKEIPFAEWNLNRKNKAQVKGYGYTGTCTRISNIDLEAPLTIVGYNHNIQSSFGVTSNVQTLIQQWIAEQLEGTIN